MKRILAIDYGERRCGLAWTDPTRQLALPLDGIATHEVWRWLEERMPQVERLVIGYPRQLNGAPHPFAKQVERFIRAFQQRYPHIPVERVDERFTTQAASRYLHLLPKKTRRVKAQADRIAATILLETYLRRGASV
ncbi:MAG: Holliday junction resolvase RuvX [Bacteroidia bacterium]|nr:Holliday junction resolvase RuvX [Bacteroidia bacterium]MDW8089635.1 Holliday junction resolvase RuvX [Bacteroidia bacterium]